MNLQLQQYNLTDKQKRYAEWLVDIETRRIPRYAHELATELGVTPVTLSAWKKIPDLIDYRRDLLHERGEDLVPLAMAVLKNLLLSKDVRTQEKAAAQILERWGETRTTVSLASVMEFYKLVEKTKDQQQKGLKKPDESMLVPSMLLGENQAEIIEVEALESTPSST